MKRNVWALLAAAGIIAMAASCMPDELTDAELAEIAHNKGGGENPGGDCVPPEECCVTTPECMDKPHLHCFEPVCTGGRCVKTLSEPKAPGTVCAVPDCPGCICAGPKDVPNTEEIGHCVPN